MKICIKNNSVFKNSRNGITNVKGGSTFLKEGLTFVTLELILYPEMLILCEVSPDSKKILIVG